MSQKKFFNSVDNKVDFITIEHEMLSKWEAEKTFEKLVKKIVVISHGHF